MTIAMAIILSNYLDLNIRKLLFFIDMEPVTTEPHRSEKCSDLFLLWPHVTERMASLGAHVLLAITVLGCLYLPRVEPRAHWGATDLHRCGRSGDPSGRVSQVHQSSTNHQGGSTAELINCEGMYTWGVTEEIVVKLERLQFLRIGDNSDECEWRPNCLIPWPKWTKSADDYLTGYESLRYIPHQWTAYCFDKNC